MSRPTRSPQGKAVRLTIYVEPETKRLLTEHAAATYQSPGEIVDKVVNDFLINPVAPKLSSASVPTAHAGQPGVEHRAAAKEGTSTAAARTIETVDIPVNGPAAFYDHPGWKLSATGQNVCIRCGKTKIRSKNASCKAP